MGTPATGYQPLYNGQYSTTVDRNSMERVVTRLLKKLGKRKGLMLALNGAAVGGAAQVNRKRVAHSLTELGGIRQIENNYLVNRNTAAADETAGDALLNQTTRIATPTNKAGRWPYL